MAEGLTIQQVADQTGLSVHTLRYYERAGLVLGIGRQTGGQRRYTEDDLSALDFVQRLRRTGMPIRHVRRYVELVREGDDTQASRQAILLAHRSEVVAQMEELQRCLDVIDAKIAYYETGQWPEGKVPAPPHVRRRQRAGERA